MRTQSKKKFDCVEMKNRIQRELRAEFESRRDEFDSYGEFISAKANASPWVRKMREKWAKERRDKG